MQSKQFWSYSSLYLPLKFTWKISRNSSDIKRNFFIRFQDSNISGVGEVAPNIRYNETYERVINEFSLFCEKIGQIKSLDELHQKLKAMNLCHSLSFGIEAAYIDYLTKREKKSWASYFNLPEVSNAATSFSIPIMGPEKLEEFVLKLKRFPSLKVKVDRDSAIDMLKVIHKLSDRPLRIDGNEAWDNPEDFIRFCEKLRGMNVEFIEQPLKSILKTESRYVFKYCPHTLIADESVEDVADFTYLKTAFHGINVKLMKAGSFLTALELLKAAKAHGMKTMIGSMVETSLGISQLYALAGLADFKDLDGFLLLKEDPFQLLVERGGYIFRNN